VVNWLSLNRDSLCLPCYEDFRDVIGGISQVFVHLGNVAMHFGDRIKPRRNYPVSDTGIQIAKDEFHVNEISRRMWFKLPG